MNMGSEEKSFVGNVIKSRQFILPQVKAELRLIIFSVLDGIELRMLFTLMIEFATDNA